MIGGRRGQETALTWINANPDPTISLSINSGGTSAAPIVYGGEQQ